MITEYLKILASDIKNNDLKKRVNSSIEKFSEKLNSRDYLLIDIKEMESIYSPDKVEEIDADKTIKKITLDI